MATQHIQLKNQKELDDLGILYKDRLDRAVDARDELAQKTWGKAQENYEGKVPPQDWPWPKASNAHVPITPTDCDAYQARLFNASCSNDPTYLILPVGAKNLAAEYGPSDFATDFQEVSQHIEREWVGHKDAMEEITTLMPKYGDAFAMVLWENEIVKEVPLDGVEVPVEKGDFPPTRDLLDRPVIHVIHPKDFIMSVGERNPQLAPWCGVNIDYDIEAVRLKGVREDWMPKQVDKLIEWLGEKTKKQQKKDAKGRGWFRTMADGREMTPDEIESEQRRFMGVNTDDNPNSVRLTHVWARIDIDQDDVQEEINFLIHRDSGIIVALWHNQYLHRLRPIVPYSFIYREGTWLSIGVAEMLFNVQEILNDIMRDMLNNNKIRNTSIFIGKAGSGIEDKTVMYPSRFLLLRDPEKDFRVEQLGTGAMSVRMQDLATVTSWGDKRTGLQEPQMGREKFSRTPATTMLSMLEQGNERIVRIIDRMKDSQAIMWHLVLSLYIQKGFGDEIIDILGEERGMVFMAVLDSLDDEDILKKVQIRPQVSTKVLNRGIQKQETQELMGLMDVVYNRLFGILQALRQTQDPVMQALLMTMAKGLESLVKRLLSTYDEKDENLNPSLTDLLKESGGEEGGTILDALVTNPFTNEGGRSDQLQEALGILGNSPGQGVQGSAPGRPKPGVTRT